MRVLLADDHRMMREGLRAILEKEGHTVAGEASTGMEAVALGLELGPDIVVMDVSMPELNGVEATRRLLAAVPGVKVIALSMHADRRYVRAMLDAGAVGYLLKHSASEELIRAIHASREGEIYLSPDIDLSEGSLPRLGARPERPLTTREREVLKLLAEGNSSKEIASRLDIAVPTVETHRRQIMAKLGLRTIAELTKYAVREGLTLLDR